MKKTTTMSTLMTVILLLAFFGNTASAQQVATSKASTKAEYLKETQQHAATVTGKNTTGLIYENYKGLTNLAEAKVAWVKDNPELYKKMTEEHNVPAASKTSNPLNEKNGSQ